MWFPLSDVHRSLGALLCFVLVYLGISNLCRFFFFAILKQGKIHRWVRQRCVVRDGIILSAMRKATTPSHSISIKYTHNTRKFSFLLLTLWSFDGMLFVLWIKVIYKMEFACVLSYLDIWYGRRGCGKVNFVAATVMGVQVARRQEFVKLMFYLVFPLRAVKVKNTQYLWQWNLYSIKVWEQK